MSDTSGDSDDDYYAHVRETVQRAPDETRMSDYGNNIPYQHSTMNNDGTMDYSQSYLELLEDSRRQGIGNPENASLIPIRTPSVVKSTERVDLSTYSQNYSRRNSDAAEQMNLSNDATMLIGETEVETILRLSNEFAPIIEKDADTLVYIGPPPQAAGQDNYTYEYIEQHFSKPYLMHSETLKGVGSSKFNKFLGPMSARTERKLKKVRHESRPKACTDPSLQLGVHKRIMSPEKIKYYIDLRPMVDDEEALIMLTELSSTSGILKWHQNAHKYQVGPHLVYGRDDMNIPPQPIYKSSLMDVVDEEPRQPIIVRDFQPITIQPGDFRDSSMSPKPTRTNNKRQIENRNADRLREMRERLPEADYSSLRHHSAIERLLHAISGNDPKLDSAPKAWTFFSIAKYFGCAGNPRISDWLTTWLLRENNDNFIQNNPEVVYRMALGMKMPDMIRCSFAMLVGEKALLQLHDPNAGHQSRKSVHGRLLGLLDDDEINRIDHAGPSLLYRVKQHFATLIHPDLIWAKSSPLMKLIDAVQLTSDDEQAVLNCARYCLHHYVRRIILRALSELPGRPEVTTEAYHANRETYGNLPLSDRILTKTFWDHLAKEQLHHQVPDTADWTPMINELCDRGFDADSLFLVHVSVEELTESIQELNKVLHKYKDLLPEYKTIPQKGFEMRQPGIDEYGRPIRPRLPALTPFEQEQRETSVSNPLTVRNGALRETEDVLAAVQQQRIEWDQTKKDLATVRKRVLPVDETPQQTQEKVTFQGAGRLKSSFSEILEALKPEETSWWDEETKSRQVVDELDEEDQSWWEDNIHRRESQTEKPEYNHNLETKESSKTSGTDAQAQVLALRQRKIPNPDEGVNQDQADETEQQPATKKRVSFGGTSQIPFAIPLHQRQSSSEDIKPALPQTTYITAQGTLFRPPGETKYINPNQPPIVKKPSRLYDDYQQSQLSYLGDRELLFHIDGLISPSALLGDLTNEMHKFIYNNVLTPGYVADHTCDIGIPNSDLDILECLNDDEWKYLPLWAGGLDDGSGGVFANDDLGLGVGGTVPNALDIHEGGFRGGPTAGLCSSGAPTEVMTVDGFSVVHRSVGMGESAGVSEFGDEFEEIKTDEGISTVGKASRIATDGTRDSAMGDRASTVMSMDE